MASNSKNHFNSEKKRAGRLLVLLFLQGTIQPEIQMDPVIVFGMIPFSPVYFRCAMIEAVDDEEIGLLNGKNVILKRK